MTPSSHPCLEHEYSVDPRVEQWVLNSPTAVDTDGKSPSSSPLSAVTESASGPRASDGTTADSSIGSPVSLDELRLPSPVPVGPIGPPCVLDLPSPAMSDIDEYSLSARRVFRYDPDALPVYERPPDETWRSEDGRTVFDNIVMQLQHPDPEINPGQAYDHRTHTSGQEEHSLIVNVPLFQTSSIGGSDTGTGAYFQFKLHATPCADQTISASYGGPVIKDDASGAAFIDAIGLDGFEEYLDRPVLGTSDDHGRTSLTSIVDAHLRLKLVVGGVISDCTLTAHKLGSYALQPVGGISEVGDDVSSVACSPETSHDCS